MRFVPGFVPEGGGLDAAGQQFIHRPRAWLSQPTSGQRLRKPCRNPGHLRYPRLHPTCSQAACQGRARAPQSTMTKVGKSHSKGTFAGAFGNDEDAPTPAVRPTTASRLKSTLCGHPGAEVVARDRYVIFGDRGGAAPKRTHPN